MAIIRDTARPPKQSNTTDILIKKAITPALARAGFVNGYSSIGAYSKLPPVLFSWV
jgi:hypothetical protein